MSSLRSIDSPKRIDRPCAPDSGGSVVFDTVPDMRVAVAALDGVFDSGLSVVLDVLATANTLRDDVAGAPPPLEVVITGLATMARTGHGLTVETVPLATMHSFPTCL